MPYPYGSFREWLDDEEKWGNVLRIRTPIKCGDYRNLVDTGVWKYNPVHDPHGWMKGLQPETEMRAVLRYLHSLPGNPIGIIENPVDNRPDIPIITNLWPNYQRALEGMGFKDKFEFIEKVPTLLTRKVRPVVVSKDKAPCKQVVIRDEKLDLRKDIPRPWVEFNKLCFAGCNGTIIAYDPKTRTHGLTKTRLGFFDWDNGDPKQPFPQDRVRRYGFATMARPGRPGQGNTGRYYFENYRSRGKSWPAVYVYGVPTDMHVLAGLKTLRWPETGDEYEIVGGFRGQPVELVECETVPGLMVPATAEWIIEGEFISEDYTTPEYSEDLGSGCIWGQAIWPVFKVNCITHREFPLWDGTTFSSMGSVDHEGSHQGLLITINADMITMLRSKGYRVKDITSPGIMTTVIQLDVDGKDKPYSGYAEEIGRLAGNKFTIVVGPDVDPNNLEEVFWAMGMRAGRNKWYDFPQAPPGVPPAPRYGMLTEMGAGIGYTVIDATIPVPERFESYPPRTEPPAWEAEAIARMRRKIERLD